MANNISHIKYVLKKWSKSFKDKTQFLLKEAEVENERSYSGIASGSLSISELTHLLTMEACKNSILEK
jgi:hypothetical protein